MSKQEECDDGGIMKVWSLNYLQSVRADNSRDNCAIQFIHNDRRRRTNYYNNVVMEEDEQLSSPPTTTTSLSLTRNQFYNLNDIILNWEEYERIVNIPIGKHVWLYNKRQMKHLYNSYTRKYFTFFYQSWLEYKATVHYLVFHFLQRQPLTTTTTTAAIAPNCCYYYHHHHGKRIHRGRRRRRKRYNGDNDNRLQDHKYLEKQSTAAHYRSRVVAQTHTNGEILHRSTENAYPTLNKRTKYSTIPERENSSVGCDFKFRRTADEIRATSQNIGPIFIENERTTTTGEEEETSPVPSTTKTVELFPHPDTSSSIEVGDIESCSID